MKPQEKERKRFYTMALASLRETQTLLQLLDQKESFELANNLGGGVYRLINPKPRSPAP